MFYFFKEFTTNEFDRPLIVQFAANTCDDLATATRFVMKYSDGVELNCGCPQRWAIQVIIFYTILID